MHIHTQTVLTRNLNKAVKEIYKDGGSLVTMAPYTTIASTGYVTEYVVVYKRLNPIGALARHIHDW